jgi:uncharacterized membrane protein
MFKEMEITGYDIGSMWLGGAIFSSLKAIMNHKIVGLVILLNMV